MKYINLNTNVILALVTTVLIATGVPAQAEENGFTLEDSIRSQIFTELKSNVENLYQSSQLLVPNIDTAKASRIAGNTSNSHLVLPISVNSDSLEPDNTVENIN
jgi:hypothetical protein